MEKQLPLNEEIRKKMLEILGRIGHLRSVELFRETQMAFGFSNERYAEDGIPDCMLRRRMWELIGERKIILTADRKLSLPEIKTAD